MNYKQKTFRIPLSVEEKFDKRLRRIQKEVAKMKGVRKISRDDTIVYLVDTFTI